MNLLPKHWKCPLSGFVQGKFLSENGAKLMPVVCTATLEHITSFEQSSSNVIESAIQKSKSAQLDWKKVSLKERSKVLRRISDALHQRNDEIALIESLDTSRVINETKSVDVISAKDCFEFYANAIHSNHSGESIELSQDCHAITSFEPLGVIAAIGAWNYPIQSMAWKVAPALAAGNGIVFKPSEETILSALILAEIIEDCGVPSGLVNVVLGEGKEVGKILTTHPDVAKISFTGSLPTGVQIAKDAAHSDLERVQQNEGNCDSTLKSISLELGGKSPLIIFQDCDLNEAVSAAMMANFYSNGQVCSNGTRVFVHKDIKPEFTKELKRRTELIKLGDPFDSDSQLSSLISKSHAEKVMNYIELGIQEGAKLVTGGNIVKDVGECCIAPTIFDDCYDEMRIVKEEIFGPVMCLLELESFDEVIKRANDTAFGLAAGIFTNDMRTARYASKELKAGMVYLNTFNLAPVEVPWGGMKWSGKGRENGIETLKHFSQSKTVITDLGKMDCAFE